MASTKISSLLEDLRKAESKFNASQSDNSAPEPELIEVAIDAQAAISDIEDLAHILGLPVASSSAVNSFRIQVQVGDHRLNLTWLFQLVGTISETPTLCDAARKLPTNSAKRLMDCLLRVLRFDDRAPHYPTTLRLLQDLSDVTDSLPSSLHIHGLVRISRVTGGGEADIWQCEHRTANVASREFRIPTEMNDEEAKLVRKTIRREALAHSQLQHRHIVKLLGVCSDDHHPLSIITPWLPNGHARGYVAAHPESFRGIITGTAAGLSYLHNKLPPIIHGDIRGNNILVDPNGEPVICDFGLTKIRHEYTRTFTRTLIGGSTRFIAPELIESETGEFRTTAASDCYAFAMTILELGTSNRPFSNLLNDFAVIRALERRVRPSKPEKMANLSAEHLNRLWTLVEAMWSHDPRERPRLSDVHAFIEQCFESKPHEVAELSLPTLPHSMTEDGPQILFYVKALYDYNGFNLGVEDLEFQAGDIFYVTATPDDGWWVGEHLNPTRRQPGRRLLPSNFVVRYQPPPA